MLARLRAWVETLKRDVMALWFCYRDPRTPWHAKLVAALVAGYALSPIDLIPDFIPVLGYLDDLVLVPAGIWLALRLIPPYVLAANRARAAQWFEERREQPINRMAAWIIGAIWVALAIALVWWGAGRIA